MLMLLEELVDVPWVSRLYGHSHCALEAELVIVSIGNDYMLLTSPMVDTLLMFIVILSCTDNGLENDLHDDAIEDSRSYGPCCQVKHDHKFSIAA